MDRSRILPLALFAMLAVLVTACAPPAAAAGHLSGAAVAGPTCPVVTDPPQSGCAARPVAGATLFIVDATGHRVASVTTDDDGAFALDLAPGTYDVQPQPVQGLMGTAPPVSVSVASGETAEVTVSYDTGIR